MGWLATLLLIVFGCVLVGIGWLWWKIRSVLYSDVTVSSQQWVDVKDGRDLDVTETAMARMNDRNGALVDTNVIFIQGPPLREKLVREALLLLQQRHGMLQMIIQQQPNNTYKFQAMKQPTIDLVVLPEPEETKPVVGVSEGDQWWTDEVRDELDKPFVNGEPLFRVRLFEPKGEQETYTTMVWSFHHAAFDGGAIMFVYQDFLTVLGQLANGETVKTTTDTMDDTNKTTALLHRSHQLQASNMNRIDYEPMYKPLFGTIWHFMRHKSMFDWKRWLPTDNSMRKTCIFPMVVSKEKLKLVIQKAKANGVTVHAVLFACAVSAYRRSHEVTESCCSVTVHSMSLRSRAKPPVPPNTLLSAVLALPIHSHLSAQPNITQPTDWLDHNQFWALAKDAYHILHSSELSNLIGGMRRLFEYFASGDKPPAKEDPNTTDRVNTLFNISNRGRFPGLDQQFGPFRFAGTFWSTAEHKGGHPYTHNIVSSAGGNLFWTISYYTHVSTLQQTQRYAQAVMETIDEICK